MAGRDTVEVLDLVRVATVVRVVQEDADAGHPLEAVDPVAVEDACSILVASSLSPFSSSEKTTNLLVLSRWNTTAT
jgi:hypothetical protein